MASHGLIHDVLPALGALGSLGGLGAVAAMLTWWVKRREVRLADQAADDAETQRAVAAAQGLTSTALSLLEPVKTALSDAEQRIRTLQKQVRDLEDAANTLTQAMNTLTASSAAERAQLEQQLSEVTADRDAARTDLENAARQRDELLAALATRDAELAALRRQGNPA